MIEGTSGGRSKADLESGLTKDKRGRQTLKLREAVKLLPTPQAWDGSRGPDNSRLRGDGKRPSGQQGTLNLAGAIQLLPTPTTQDAANCAGPSQWHRNSDPLNVVAAKLSGATSPKRSDAGS